MQGVGSYLAMPSIRKPYPHTHGFPARSRAVPRAARRAQASLPSSLYRLQSSNSKASVRVQE